MIQSIYNKHDPAQLTMKDINAIVRHITAETVENKIESMCVSIMSHTEMSHTAMFISHEPAPNVMVFRPKTINLE